MKTEYIALLIAVLGWPISAILAYRFGIRSKKKDALVVIINKIRKEAEYYFKELFPSAEREGFLQYPNYEITDKIEEIIAEHSSQLGYFQKRKIRKTFQKIDLLFRLISADSYENEKYKEYHREFYGFLNEINFYK